MKATIARVAVALSLVAAHWAGASRAQEHEAPRLPKGEIAPPAGLLEGLPADAAEVYRPIPRADDAEVAYLVALSEFDSAMAECWPEQGRREREELLHDRRRRLDSVLDPSELEGKPIDAKARDASIAEFRQGWEGLVRAQERPRCRFRIAIDPGASSHAFAASAAVKIARLLASADLERGDLNAAIGRLSVVLRLSRDLRPGGNMVCQVASIAIDASAFRNIALPILGSPDLRPEHCDRLSAVFSSQEREGLDCFRAMLVPDALTQKSMLQAVRSDPKLRASVVDLYHNDAPGSFASLFSDLLGERREADSRAANRAAGDRLAAMTDADFAAALKAIDTYVGLWWRLTPPSHEARVGAAPVFAREAVGDDPFLGQFIPGAPFYKGMAESAARESYTLGAAQALAAIRRWTLEHDGLPPNLTVAAKAAGLTEVPRDPFADTPLKLTVIDESLTIYSIGPDHKDDGGKVDANFGQRRNGDWLTKLSAPTPGR